MISNRCELNKTLNIDAFFPTFFSALVPCIGRPDYELACVDSILKNADLPVEIIVHDDGSSEEKRVQQYNLLKDKVSTFVLNMGFNTGLARSMNRCKMMSSSNYLIGFNSDECMTSSFLKAMKEALDLPYVGMVNVTQSIGDGPGVYTTKSGYKVALLKGTGSCHCYGIKKERWDEIGGWDENVQTTASDVGFVGNLFGHGYFCVVVEGTITNEMWPKSPDGKINIPGTSKVYVETGQFCRNDNNVPKIFGEKDHAALCEKRRCKIWEGTNLFSNKELLYPQWYNHRFQADQVEKMYPRNIFIDWEFAKEYGHDKWEEAVRKDFNI